jgi:integrase
VQRHRSSGSYEGYRYRLQRFAEHYPDLSPAHLRPHHVEKWADQYDIKQTTRRNYLRAVKRCLKWAKSQGYIDTNPIENLEVPAAENKEVVVKPDDFVRLLTLIRDRSLHDLIVTAWETGCRPQEILRVEARHVDFANQRWVFSKSEAKMKRISRVVYLTDRAAAITRRLTLKYPDGRLFRNSRGAPWTTMAVNCAFIRLQWPRLGRQCNRRQCTSRFSRPLCHLGRSEFSTRAILCDGDIRHLLPSRAARPPQ